MTPHMRTPTLCARSGRTVLALVICVSLIAATPLQAQVRRPSRAQPAEAAEPGKPALRLKVFEELQAIQLQIDGGDTAGAITRLQALSAGEQADAFAFGIIQQYLVQAFVSADRLEDARNVAEGALLRDDLDPDARGQLRYVAGKLAVLVDEFDVAIAHLDRWIQENEDASGEGQYLIGYAHYRRGDSASAERHLREAVQAPSVPDGWYDLLFAVLLEQKKFAEAQKLLERRIAAAPDRIALWQSLAGVQLQRGDEQRALATLMLAHRRGLITEIEALERLIRMHQNLGMPDRAARLLEQWTNEGRLDPDAARLEWLGQLWLQARERARAKDSLALAIRRSETGRAADLLGRLEFEDENWAAALDALEKARKLGSLDSPHQTALLLGIAALREQSFPTARAALEAAAAHPETASQATYWLSRVQ